MSTFQDAIKNFKPVLAADAQEVIDAGQDLILFIGRETCPYCQRFAPKLAAVAEATGAAVSFLNSQNPSDEGIQALRDRYGVPTVPGLLVAKAGQVKVVCDSSLPEEAIADFIA